ncbi:MAG: hypothetical protein IJT73_01030 [Selenomonadaceae bacterium]|nr:hypothetical protein [Selenomonadaceae bacterium]
MFETIPSWLVFALIGGGAAVFALKSGILPLSIFPRSSIKEMVKSQIVDDEFDGRSLIQWINKNSAAGNVKILLVKPTKAWIKKLNLKDAEKIDAEKNLIGCIVDMQSEKVLKMQLFSFSSMSNSMQAKFNGEDQIVLT